MKDSRDASTPEIPDAAADRLEEFREPLRIFAARRLRDWTAAEDVAQETLTFGFEALQAGRLENPEALPGYLFQTATHLCLRRFRSAERERRAFARFEAGRSVRRGRPPRQTRLGRTCCRAPESPRRPRARSAPAARADLSRRARLRDHRAGARRQRRRGACPTPSGHSAPGASPGRHARASGGTG